MTPDLLFIISVFAAIIATAASSARLVWTISRMKKSIHNLGVRLRKHERLKSQLESLQKELIERDNKRETRLVQMERQQSNLHNWQTLYGDRLQGLETTVNNALVLQTIETESTAINNAFSGERVQPSENDKELWDDLDALKEHQATINIADYSSSVDPLTYSRQVGERIQELELSRTPSPRAQETVTTE